MVLWCASFRVGHHEGDRGGHPTRGGLSMTTTAVQRRDRWAAHISVDRTPMGHPREQYRLELRPEVSRPRALPDELTRLTDRELTVLRAMATGASNAEIASDLFLSVATVKTHVARVLAKLGLRDRVQAVVYAYESRLVVPR